MNIGIVGYGISGLHLALYLQRHKVEVTLYSPRDMASFAAGPIPNFVTRWKQTLAREEELGVSAPERYRSARMRMRIAAEPEIVVDGTMSAPAETTDFRVHLPRLLEAFTARGGRTLVTDCGPRRLYALAAAHDLVVVGAGREFGNVFGRDAQRSPHTRPARRWCVGLFNGLGTAAGTDIEVSVVPGVGEFYHMPINARRGREVQVGFAALPDAPLVALTEIAPADPAFAPAILDALRAHVPHLADRIDPVAFAPTSPSDVLQGGFTPVVRHAWARVGDAHVLAMGDAWVLNDPIIAQGANLASRTAFIIGEAIVAGGPFDGGFCRRTAETMWAAAAAPCAITNAFLAPPPPDVVEVFRRAGTDPELADRVMDGVGDPTDLLALLAGRPAHV